LRVNYRNTNIDALRGLAIVIMIIAHLSPHLETNLILDKFWIRFICSLAAPIFLFILGYNLKKNSSFNKKKYYLKGIIIILNACLIDLFLWKIVPFFSFDVLYIIGISILTFPIWHKYKLKTIFNLLIIFILSAVFINFFKCYTNVITEINLNEISKFDIRILFYNLLINGWFPLFPWLGIIFYGYVIDEIPFIKNKVLLTIFALIVFIASLFFILHSENFVREFSVEIFYPMNIYFLLCALSFLTVLRLYFFENLKFPLNILSTLGKSSLFMYSFHLVFISFFFNKIHKLLDSNFFYTCLTFVCFFIAVSYFINFIKKKILTENRILKIILGG